MKITKLGHCCLIIEENKIRIMTDPGAWSQAQNSVKNIDLILITHEHQDHFHLDSLKQVMENNPKAKIVTNSAVGKLLDEQKISHQILEHGQNMTFKEILIEGFGEKHALIYEKFGQVQNTGYFIANKLFYPGDSFYDPRKPVEILALPVCGPWMRISEAIDYAKQVKPKVCFPVHDGMLKILGPFHLVPQTILKESGLEFKILEPGDEVEL